MSRIALVVLLLPQLALAAPRIELVTLTQGLKAAPQARDLLARESLQANGPTFAVDAPAALPEAVAAFGNGKLFYALFNNFADPETTKAYAIQRIRKTVLNYRSAADTQP